MAKFISLGSGSSGNCYYFSTDTTTILIDAGLSMRKMRTHLKGFGLSLDKVDAVFVTHDHADHIKAVGDLANEMNKPIYATQLVHEGINRNYCISSKLTEKHIRYVHKGEQITIGDIRITPFEVPHDSTDCVGYMLELDGAVFCLITDVGQVTPIIEEMVSRANYLVIESNYDQQMLLAGKYPAHLKGRIQSGRGHLSNALTAKLIAEHCSPALKHIWLCHLSQENNHPELARITVDTTLRGYGLIPGVDFNMDVLRRKTPSEVFEITAKEEKM